MGYDTHFQGHFKLDRPLDEETKTFLTKLATTRRMKRHTSSEYGVDGEFYVDGGGFMGQEHDATVVNYNIPPVTQPGLWCQWIPNEEGTEIAWDGGEKFYCYVEWLQYIVSRVLNVKNYTLNGSVYWQGEDDDDFGVIEVKDSIVQVKNGRKVYE
jgi:hypothetical protein